MQYSTKLFREQRMPIRALPSGMRQCNKYTSLNTNLTVKSTFLFQAYTIF